MNTESGRHPAVRPAAGSRILRAAIAGLIIALVALPAPILATPLSPHALTPAYMWHTFYGSGGSDGGLDSVLDDDGNLYTVGISDATWNGPAGQLPLHAHSGGNDILVVKLDRNGAYLWHTFYGSSAPDTGRQVAVDVAGNVYIAGQSDATWQGDGNTNPLHAYGGATDAVFVKLNSAGAYQWHTFYGAPADPDYGFGIAMDSQNAVRISMHSDGTWNGPAGQVPLHDWTVGGGNMAALKLDANGTYQWHTFYRGVDGYGGLALDDTDNVYLGGYCDVDWNGPTGQPPLHARTGVADLLVVKLAGDGTYQWHTFYGSGSREWGYGIAVDGSGNVSITGRSEATWDGPAGEPPRHTYTGGIDLVVLNLSSAGAYQWHTFFGTSGEDTGYGVAVDIDGNIFVAGYSPASWNGPSGELPLHTYTGGWEIVGMRLAIDGSYRWHTFYGSASDDHSYSVVVDSRGSGYITGISAATWQGDGNTVPLHAHSGGWDAVVVKLATYRMNLPVVLRQYP